VVDRILVARKRSGRMRSSKVSGEDED